MNGMKMLGTPLSKKEDRLAEAGKLMLKSGNFQAYCVIQMQLGNFEDAISCAPKVSMKYWKQCVEKYELQLSRELEGAGE
jgi:WD repeat-containing protein 17